MKAFFVAKLLAADVALAVVGREDDDGVLREAVFVELFEDQADFAVELAGGIKILSPVLSGDLVIGIVGRDLDQLRIGLLGRVKLTMRFLEVDLGDKRLV